MNKKEKYALRGLAIGAIIKLLINGIKQYQKIEEDPAKKFDWEEFLLEGGKGALIGGGIGLGIGAIEDAVTANEKPINTDNYLNLFVNSVQVDKNSKLHKASERKCDEIISFLEEEFGEDLSRVPFIWGSNAKGTALDGNSDFDIVTQFRTGTYTLEEMYYEIHDAFENSFDDDAIIEVRKQSKSIGLLFEVHGEQVRIDIVPVREMDNNPKNTAGSMYVQPDGIFSSPTFTKTDIGLQAAEKISPTQKKLIIALKKWRDDFSVPMSSYMIQLLVLRAYYANKYNIPKSLTDKLLMVIEFIRDNIEGIRLVSIENTNNNVNDIPDSDKRAIATEAKKALEEIEYNPNYIKNFFSI
jgi:hypothetical protein